MRKLIVYTLLLLISFQSAIAADFTVTGKMKGLTNGSTATLKNVFNGQSLATATIADGAFVLKGNVNEGMLMQLSFSAAPQLNIELFIGNETVVIDGDLAAPDQIKLTGSVVHQTYEKFRQQFVPMKDKLNAIVPLIQAETAQTPKRDSLINLFNSYKQVLLNETVGFMNANPTSVVSSFALYAVGPLLSSPQELESKFNALQPAAQKGYFSELIVKSLNDAKVGQIGSMATEFTQNDQYGKPIKLSSFRGKYVLIDFWASWCRPCRQENPNVVKAYNTYKAKNFTVLGVSLDQDKASWIQAIAADKLTWTHVSDLKYWSNEVAQLYHIQSIPANMLIDPTGKIIGKDLRGEELLQKLATILK
ncbi:MAG: hypothetical protein RL544_126 [Bacteroidota bacterium]|jgi:peroxiredoxin